VLASISTASSPPCARSQPVFQASCFSPAPRRPFCQALLHPGPCRPQAGTAIVWATGRPTDSNPAAVNLYAFAATPSRGTLPLLYSSPAGSWGNTGGNANIMPLVANGYIFVAGNQQLTIFGLGGHPFVARAGAAARLLMKSPGFSNSTDRCSRSELAPVKIARVDDSEALRRKQIGVLVPGYARSKEPMIRPARCVRRPSRVQRIRPRFGRWIADD
jgi:hypothetical protein